jgi:GAF domain-containing protein
MRRHECALCDLTNALFSEGANLRATLNVLLNYVTTRLHVHAADVLLYNTAASKLVYAGGRGFHTQAFENSTLRLGDALASQAVRERRMVFISNLTKEKTDLARSPELASEGFITYLGIPLLVKDQLQGLLEIFHRERLNPTAEWLSLVEAIAEKSAVAINNILLVRRLQYAQTELAQAYDATIASCARPRTARL